MFIGTRVISKSPITNWVSSFCKNADVVIELCKIQFELLFSLFQLNVKRSSHPQKHIFMDQKELVLIYCYQPSQGIHELLGDIQISMSLTPSQVSLSLLSFLTTLFDTSESDKVLRLI